MSKYIFSLLIAVGLLFSLIPKPAIVYNCKGPEVFPAFYASPFIYKSSSLATSLAYDFYIIGLIGNILFWTILILVVRLGLVKLFGRRENVLAKRLYRVLKYTVTVILVLSTIMYIYNFTQTWQLNPDLHNEAKDWGMTCAGHFSFI